jgi:1,5-anhydro-D-fructose reductase (1,5-anhydro-D-mannitol-forming)
MTASLVAFYDDYHDLVANSRVDAVVVAVPPTLHPAIVEAACRAGKPLLVEKPLATSLAEARHIASMLSAHVPEIGPLHGSPGEDPERR